MPQKAFNIRRNPKVSMLFSEPTGSGIAQPGAVFIQGDATVEDRIVTDPSSDPDLAALMETVSGRQPAGAFWSTRLGRRVGWPYYIRLLIYVIPHDVLCTGRPATSPPLHQNSTSTRCVVWDEAATWLDKFPEAVLTAIDRDGYPVSDAGADQCIQQGVG